MVVQRLVSGAADGLAAGGPSRAADRLSHLDGNFSEEGAWQDSEVYLPKVVPGGYILLSNALVSVAGQSAKMKALWPLFDRCDVVCEIDDSNTLLFRKR